MTQRSENNLNDTDNRTDTDSRMLTTPVGRLLLSLAIPTVLAQLVNLLYNIVDRMFVGRIPGSGSLALAGLGVTFPIMVLVMSFANLIGMGGAPRAAIAMGKGEKERAEKILGNSCMLLVMAAVILTAVFLLCRRVILTSFGASEATYPYADSYITIYLLGTIFVLVSLGLNAFITNQGFARTSMATVCIGAVINIVLDFVFIYCFHMGVRGAALATIISQAVSAVWVLRFLTGKKAVLRLRWKNLRLEKEIVASIITLGISPFIMTSTECLIQLTFNSGMQRYGGDVYVAIMSILFSLSQLLQMPMSGLAMGAQPIISYNYGAGNMQRVKNTFRMLFVIMTAGYFLIVAGMEFFPETFLRLFTEDMELITTGAPVLGVFMLGMALMGAQGACQNTFVALGEAKVSISMALLRKIVLLIPLALILPHVAGLGLWGVILAEPISDAISAVTTTTVFYIRSRKVLR